MCTIAAKLAYWANIEKLHLTTQQPEVFNEFKDLESSIVDFYEKFLMLISSEKGNIVHSAHAPSRKQLYNAYCSPGFFNSIRHYVTAPIDAPNWDKLMIDFKVSYESCETKLRSLNDGIAKRKDILQWISEVIPLEAHEQVLQKTHVADRYQNCGEWLLSTDIFQKWASNSSLKEYSILWLHGTGR